MRGDSAYGKAIFLAPLYDLDKLVLIVRLRPGMKVWAKAPDEEPTGGATRVYGDKFYLKNGQIITCKFDMLSFHPDDPSF